VDLAKGKPVSGGQIAALIAAGAFLLLVGILAVPLLKLGRTVDAATEAINRITDRTDPVLVELQTTVRGLNQTLAGVNHQLDKVDTITDYAQTVGGNVSALASVFTNTVGTPLIKAAGLVYGLRKAVSRRKKDGVSGRHSTEG
jgi:uncharacterized protein YoxC